MTGLAADVRRVLSTLPPGEVITYGELAREAGSPGAARAVGSALRDLSDVPWWRVVNARGRVHPGAVEEATRRLAAEGVDVVDGFVRGLSLRAVGGSGDIGAREAPAAGGRV